MSLCLYYCNENKREAKKKSITYKNQGATIPKTDPYGHGSASICHVIYTMALINTYAYSIVVAK